jgi:hypothetical protein
MTLEIIKTGGNKKGFEINFVLCFFKYFLEGKMYKKIGKEVEAE